MIPDWLANKTTGYCTSSHWESCTPYSDTKYLEMYRDFVKNITDI